MASFSVTCALYFFYVFEMSRRNKNLVIFYSTICDIPVGTMERQADLLRVFLLTEGVFLVMTIIAFISV